MNILVIDNDREIRTYIDGKLHSVLWTCDNKGNRILNSEIGTFTREECIEKGIDPDKHHYFLRK